MTIPSIRSLVNAHHSSKKALLYNGRFYSHVEGWGDRYLKFNGDGVFFVCEENGVRYYYVSFTGGTPVKIKAEDDASEIRMGLGRASGSSCVFVNKSNASFLSLTVSSPSGVCEYQFTKGINAYKVIATTQQATTHEPINTGTSDANLKK